MGDINGFDQKALYRHTKHNATQTSATPRGAANQMLRRGPAPGGWCACCDGHDGYARRCGNGQHRCIGSCSTAGFVLTPTSVRMNLSRRRARNCRQAAGQVAWAFPQSTSSRPQNKNRGRTSARAHRGVVSANEKKEKRKKENFWEGNPKIG